MRKNLLFIRCFLITCLAHSSSQLIAQSYSFQVAPNIHLPKDSAARTLLLCSLDSFLLQKEGLNRLNNFVWQPELPATSALLDEMKGIGYDDSLRDKDFFRARLINATLLRDSTYLLQLSYDAMVHNAPVHKAVFRLQAKKQGDRFYFYAPLSRNTTAWKRTKEGNVVYHYKDSLNSAAAKVYARYNELFLKKLMLADQQTELYCCDDFQEALQLTGIDYKSAYNGVRANSLSAHENRKSVIVNGYFTSAFRNFDPHDMWHEKLRIILPAGNINRPVDEGCAYLYGGSWGLSWSEIKALFKAYAQQQPDADWLQLYLAGTDFKEGQEPLKIGYFINALLIQELEQEQGFAAVMQLLSCGKKEKDDANYFAALKKLTGITRQGFNAHVQSLVSRL
jgi:hypothetical protein